MKMTFQTASRRANNALHALTLNTWFESVPINRLYEAVEGAGFKIAEDDAIVCGASGRATVPLVHVGHDEARARDAAKRLGDEDVKPVRGTQHVLVYTWHRMPSGRYEVVAYVS